MKTISAPQASCSKLQEPKLQITCPHPKNTTCKKKKCVWFSQPYPFTGQCKVVITFSELEVMGEKKGVFILLV